MRQEEQELDPHGAVGPWTDEDVASLGTDDEFQARLHAFATEHGVENLTPKLREQYNASGQGLTEGEMAEPSRHDPQLNEPAPRDRPSQNPLDPNQNTESWVDANTLDMDDLSQTDYLENYRASLGQFMDEDLSVSRMLNDPVGDRNKEISALMESGQIPDDIVQGFVLNGGDVYGNVADWANSNLGTQFPTDDTKMMENMRQTLKDRRIVNEDIFARQGTMGAVGQFAGVGNAAMVDPVNAASMLIPPLAATRGAGFLAHTVKFASKEAAIGMAAETAIQPIVYDYKDEIDSPYTVEEAVYNIMAAGVFSAGIGTVTGAAGYSMGKMATPTVKELSDAIQDGLNYGDLMMRNPDMVIPEEVVDAAGSLANLQRELRAMVEADPDSDAIESLKALDEATARMASWREEIDTMESALHTMDDYMDGLRKMEADYDAANLEIDAAEMDGIIDIVKASEEGTYEILEEALNIRMRETGSKPAPKSMEVPPTEGKPKPRTVGDAVEDAGSTERALADYIECRGRA